MNKVYDLENRTFKFAIAVRPYVSKIAKNNHKYRR